MRFEKRPFLLAACVLCAVSAAPAADEPRTLSAEATPRAVADGLDNLSPAEKKELQSKQDRFYRLDPASQDELRDLHEQLTQAPDAAPLQAVLTRYARWLQTLPSGQRADLLSLPPAERVVEIRRLLQDQTASRMRSYVPRKLADDDLRAIASWVEQLVEHHEAELLERVPPFKDQLAHITDPKQRIQALTFMIHRFGFRRDWLQPTDEEIGELRSRLSAEAQEDLDQAKAEGRLPELTAAWMGAAMFSRLAGPPVDREQLRKYYKEDLEPQQREWLESLPPERMQAELVRMYYAHRFRREGYRNWPGFRKPSSGPRGSILPPRFGPPPGHEATSRDSHRGDSPNRDRSPPSAPPWPGPPRGFPRAPAADSR